jgi:hypothetical protein
VAAEPPQELPVAFLVLIVIVQPNSQLD